MKSQSSQRSELEHRELLKAVAPEPMSHGARLARERRVHISPSGSGIGSASAFVGFGGFAGVVENTCCLDGRVGCSRSGSVMVNVVTF